MRSPTRAFRYPPDCRIRPFQAPLAPYPEFLRRQIRLRFEVKI